MTARVDKCVTLLAVVLAAGLALGWGAAPVRAAGLLIADGGFGGVLKIQEHDVKITINNSVAVTEVNQVFLNTENRIVEALYVFPVPEDASVANFSMWIEGREMIGEVVERQRAREIYNSYKQKRRDPGLLEQVNYKRFEMRIFPIAAGAEQRVRVTYYQELQVDKDWATYVYPLATQLHRTGDETTSGKFALSLEVKSVVPIVEMESPSHADEFAIVRHTDRFYQASLETSGGNLRRDVVLAYRSERPQTGCDLIASRWNNEDGFFQLSITAGKELAEQALGMDYVFVLDISGSMAQEGKLQLSRGSLGAFITSLGAEDRFELMTFNVAPYRLFNELRSPDEANRAEATQYLDSQRARGGTVLRSAIRVAYGYRDPDRTLNVVVLSDGMAEQQDVAELLALIRERPPGSRVFCVGVGNEVNRPLLTQLAEETGGLATMISRGDNFSRQAEAFRRKLRRPAIDELTVAFAGGSVYDIEPERLPALFHGSPLRIYGRYAEPGSVTVTFRGAIGGEPFEQSFELDLPAVDEDNPEIERMWAWHRVQRLLADARRQGGPPPDTVNEIVRLCEGYSIVSEYASFIVLENDGEYQRWKIERRNASRIDRDRQAQARLRQELEGLRLKAAQRVGPGGEKGDQQDALASAAADPGVSAADDRNGSRPVSPPARGGDGARSRDFNFSTGSGGGALDPISGLIALGMAGAAAAAGSRLRRRRRKAGQDRRRSSDGDVGGPL